MTRLIAGLILLQPALMFAQPMTTHLDNLKGAVKRVEVQEYYPNHKKYKDTRCLLSRERAHKIVRDFDKEGRLIAYCETNASGDTVYTEHFKYESSLKYSVTRISGSEVSESEYEVKKNDSETITSIKEGDHRFTSTVQVRPDGKWSSVNVVDSSGRPSLSHQFEYTERGDLKKRVSVIRGDTLTVTFEYSEFDLQQNWTTAVENNSNNLGQPIVKTRSIIYHDDSKVAKVNPGQESPQALFLLLKEVALLKDRQKLDNLVPEEGMPDYLRIMKDHEKGIWNMLATMEKAGAFCLIDNFAVLPIIRPNDYFSELFMAKYSEKWYVAIVD
jgi:hypothetical protein